MFAYMYVGTHVCNVHYNQRRVCLELELQAFVNQYMGSGTSPES